MGKRRPLSPVNDNIAAGTPEFRSVKREKVINQSAARAREDTVQGNIPKRWRTDRARPSGGRDEQPFQQSTVDRRKLRSHYLSVKHLINDKKEELCRGGSDKFQRILKEVDRLHEHVMKPREQVADAETLLDMADTLLASVKSHSKEGVTPSDFMNGLMREFGAAVRRRTEEDHVSVNWKALGLAVCPIFKKGSGCSTMIGPMKTELKKRKVTARTRRIKPTERIARPEQLENTEAEEKTDTDKNMATMFNVLRKQKSVRLEQLILNRNSFAQTVENLFALSFFVKDGRASVAVDDKGTHLVSPRNAPSADLVGSREVLYHHFVFRFDFKDWQLMRDVVAQGEEQMPHRYQVCIPVSQTEASPVLSQLALPV